VRPDLILKIGTAAAGVADDACALVDEVSRLTALVELRLIADWVRSKKSSAVGIAAKNPMVLGVLATLTPEKAEKLASEIWRLGLVRTVLQTATARLQRYTAVPFP
jgi:hypothetical protein